MINQNFDDHARGEEMHVAEPPPYPGMPRWVKACGIVVIALILLMVFARAFIGGAHGPGRHASSGEAGGQLPPSSVLEGQAAPEVGRG
ncbi:hypothetical protein GBA65_21210 (plasmid) [Rubrobacter marinus]|uniref:Uncharacterized protein n=1 Tax=Rubrobacter marinus TaxID=2653852 RepID=A0A6G8Q3E2_9ACTN|nr:hypothetical protein GBA65_21210 [Rubrobacter marinus]